MSGTLDPDVLQFLLKRTAAGESGGNDNAQNPYSSASGRYQITDGLWQGLQRNYPDAGLTDKNDPNQQAKGYALIMNNEVNPAFQKAGFSPQIGDYDAAWTFGAPRALRMRIAGDDAPAVSVLGDDAPKIMSQNPRYFPQGLKTTIGSMRNAVSSSYDKALGRGNTPNFPLQGAALHQTINQSQAEGDNMAGQGGLTLNADPSIPDAPEQKPSNTVTNGPWTNLLNYLANWGGGASQGSNFGESLGAGSALGAQWLGQHIQDLDKQAQENENLPTVNWENKVKTAQVRNAQMSAQAERGRTAAELLKSGFSAPNIVTLLNGQGGQLDPSGLPNPDSLRQGTPKGFMDAKYWKLTQPDGSEHNVLVSVNKDTGQPVGYDVDTGQQLTGSQMQGAFDPNNPEAVNREKASSKAEEDFGQSVASGMDTLNSVGTLKQILPHIPAGADFKSALTRGILNATGIPVGETDADSLALATKELNKLRINYMNSARTPGMRTDVPMVKALFGAVPDLTTATAPAIKTFLDETENMENYKQKLWNAWEQQPDSVRRRGFTSFRTKYQSDPETAYQPLNYDQTMQANRDWYNAATQGQQPNQPQMQPTGTTPAPRVGSGSAPTITGGWRLVKQ